MIQFIRQAFNEALDENDWMDEETRTVRDTEKRQKV